MHRRVRRGDVTWGSIISAILILVTGVLFLMLIVPFDKLFTSQGRIAACQASIETYQLRQSYNPVELVTGSRDLNCLATHNDYEEKTKQKLMHHVANELTTCWRMSLGQANKLGDDLGGDANACLVCSTFTLSQQLSTSELNTFLGTFGSKSPGPTYKEMLTTDWNVPDAGLFLKPTKESGLLCGSEITLHPDELKDRLSTLTALEAYPASYMVVAVQPEDCHEGYNHVAVIEERDIRKLSCEGLIYNPDPKSVRKVVGRSET